MKGELLGQSIDIRRRLLVTGLQLLDLLPCLGKRCLELVDLVLERCRINAKQHRASLHRFVWLDRDFDHLAGNIGRDLHDAGNHD
ncbi:hypothetical protein ACVIIZ_006427 [Bradyrhizobium sp. USDA 4523]